LFPINGHEPFLFIFTLILREGFLRSPMAKSLVKTREELAEEAMLQVSEELLARNRKRLELIC